MELPIKFIIRDDRINNSGNCPIYLRYTHKRKFVNLPVKYSILPQFWDKEDGKPKKNYPNYKNLKSHLTEFEDRITNTLEKYKGKNGTLPEANNLKSVLNDSTSIQIQQGSTPSLQDRYQDYVLYQDRDGVTKSTLNIYAYTWEKWTQFEALKKTKYTHKELNFNNLNEFRIFLKSQGLQTNTVSKYIKTIKSFLSYLVLHKELDVPVSYKKVSVEKEEPEIQVLTQEELEILKREVFFSRDKNHSKPNHNLNDREKLIGQILLFLCHTGVSYVDFLNLQIGNLIFIKEKNDSKSLQIHLTRQKLRTVSTCKIPILDLTIDLISEKLGMLHDSVEGDINDPTPIEVKIAVLENYIRKMIKIGKFTMNTPLFPKVISQVFNREIKDVLANIGINTPVFSSKFYGGSKSFATVPKYKLITSHTGRRTFITRSIENGVSHLVLMDMTGHSKVQTLARYNKNSAEFIQKEVKSKTPGQIEFKGETLKSESVKIEKKSKK
jgi:site-specific recombinase XerD